MSAVIPCIRHGHASTEDPRLVETLARVRELGLAAPVNRLTALLDYEGQLWATWRDASARAAGSKLLTRAWEQAGGERGAPHLLRSDDNYAYQEDCMTAAPP